MLGGGWKSEKNGKISEPETVGDGRAGAGQSPGPLEQRDAVIGPSERGV